jgi:hypothetical protein
MTDMKKKALVFLTIASMIVSQAAFSFAQVVNSPDANLGQGTHTEDGYDDVHSSSSSASNQDVTIPGKITTGNTGIIGLDFLISESVNMNIKANQSLMEVSDLTVKNNMVMGTIQVSNIKITAATGWTLTHQHELTDNNGGAYDTSKNLWPYFADKAANTKEFYLAVKYNDQCLAGTDQDAGTGVDKSCTYNQVFPQASNASDITVKFEGHTGLRTEAITEQAADIVVTVSQVVATS